jgi:hypothetical protein
VIALNDLYEEFCRKPNIGVRITLVREMGQDKLAIISNKSFGEFRYTIKNILDSHESARLVEEVTLDFFTDSFLPSVFISANETEYIRWRLQQDRISPKDNSYQSIIVGAPELWQNVVRLHFIDDTIDESKAKIDLTEYLSLLPKQFICIAHSNVVEPVHFEIANETLRWVTKGNIRLRVEEGPWFKGSIILKKVEILKKWDGQDNVSGLLLTDLNRYFAFLFYLVTKLQECTGVIFKKHHY